MRTREAGFLLTIALVALGACGGDRASSPVPTPVPEAEAQAPPTVRAGLVESSAASAFEAHREQTLVALFTPDGEHVLTAGLDGDVRLWTRDGRPVATLRGHKASVHGAVFSPDGARVATASVDGTTRIWDLERARDGRDAAVGVLPGDTREIAAVVTARGGNRLVTLSLGGRAKIGSWDGRVVAGLREKEADVERVYLSPAADRIVTLAPDAESRLWDGDGTLVATLDAHATEGDGARFSPDGRHVAVWGPRAEVAIYDAEGTRTARLEGHEAQVLDLAFLPGGDRLVTASLDGTARLWSLAGEEAGRAARAPGRRLPGDGLGLGRADRDGLLRRDGAPLDARGGAHRRRPARGGHGLRRCALRPLRRRAAPPPPSRGWRRDPRRPGSPHDDPARRLGPHESRGVVARRHARRAHRPTRDACGPARRGRRAAGGDGPGRPPRHDRIRRPAGAGRLRGHGGLRVVPPRGLRGMATVEPRAHLDLRAGAGAAVRGPGRRSRPARSELDEVRPGCGRLVRRDRRRRQPGAPLSPDPRGRQLPHPLLRHDPRGRADAGDAGDVRGAERHLVRLHRPDVRREHRGPPHPPGGEARRRVASGRDRFARGTRTARTAT